LEGTDFLVCDKARTEPENRGNNMIDWANEYRLLQAAACAERSNIYLEAIYINTEAHSGCTYKAKIVEMSRGVQAMATRPNFSVTTSPRMEPEKTVATEPILQAQTHKPALRAEY